MDPDPRGNMGLGGTGGGGGNLSWGSHLDAIDYQTGKVVWRREIQGWVGGLSTAGGVLFFSNGQDFEAIEAKTGKPLWHSAIGGLSSPPETFMMDGKQHVLATSGGGMHMFVLN
jgi:alcohol dehydrogenase (cytochrome c)